MEDPKIKTDVVHSKSQTAWNVIGTGLSGKFKIARIPYITTESSEIITTENKAEALLHAKFISACFNNSSKIIEKVFL